MSLETVNLGREPSHNLVERLDAVGEHLDRGFLSVGAAPLDDLTNVGSAALVSMCQAVENLFLQADGFRHRLESLARSDAPISN
jgi:hypothetical protein